MAANNNEAKKMLEFAFKNHTSFYTRLLVLSRQEKYHYLIELSILFIEYAQLASQSILAANSAYSSSGTASSPVFSFVVAISKIWIPGNLLALNEDRTFDRVLVCISMSYVILKWALFGYICYVALGRSKGSELLIRTWKFFVKIQIRVMCCLVNSVWRRAFTFAVHSGIQNEMLKSGGVLSLMGILYFGEVLLSLFCLIKMSYILPSKRFLAAKHNRLEMITLTQKLVLQAFAVIFKVQTICFIWIFTILSIVFSVIRDFTFCRSLPLYNFKALAWQAQFLIAITCLNITNIIQLIIYLTGVVPFRRDSVIVIWLILALFGMKIANSYISRIANKLADEKSDCSADVLLNKVRMIKNLMEESSFNALASRYKWSFLLNAIFIRSIDKEPGEAIKSCMDIDVEKTKAWLNKRCLGYLEDLSMKFPENELIKLYLSYYYMKKTKFYGLGLNILNKLKSSSSSDISINACLLLHDSQCQIQRIYKGGDSKIDLFSYVENLALVEGVKSQIRNQAILQIEYYQEINERHPKLQRISECGQKIDKLRVGISKKAKHMFEKIPDYYVEPLLIFAQYCLDLNHSVEDFLRYVDSFEKKSCKYQKSFQEDKLIEENLYDKNNGFMLFSCEKGKEGQFLVCSSSVEENFGQNICGGNVIDLIIPIARPYFRLAQRQIYEESNHTLLDQVVLGNFYNNFQRFVVPVYYYRNVFPFLNQGLYLFGVVRQFASKKEVIMTNSSGTIEYFSQIIGDKLSLFQGKEINIASLCLDLGTVDQAYNTVFHKSSEMTLEEAQEITTLYSSEGKILKLTPFATKGETEERKDFLYHCQVEYRFYGKTFVKIYNFSKSTLGSSDKIPKKVLHKNRKNVRLFQDFSLVSPEKKNVKESDYSPIMTSLKPPATETVENFTQEQDLPPQRSLLSEHTIPNEVEEVNKHPETEKKQATVIVLDKLETDSDQEDKASSNRNWTESALHDIRNDAKGVHEKEFEKAIATKYYPFFYRILRAILYMSFGAIVAIQAISASNVINGMNVLKAYKDVTSAAEVRNTNVMLSQRKIFILYSFAINRIERDDLDPFFDYEVTSFYLQINLENLVQNNDALVQAANLLKTAADREKLFEKNVRLFYTDFNERPEVFSTVTSFQALSDMVQAGLFITDNSYEDRETSIPSLIFIIRNAMNDLFLEGEYIADLFFESSKKQYDASLENSLKSSLVSFILLAFVFLVYMIVLIHQYKEEENLLGGLIRTNKSLIKESLHKARILKKRIEEDDSFDNVGKVLSRKNLKLEKDKIGSQIPNTRGLSRKYQINLAALLAVLMLIAICIVVSTVLFRAFYKDLMEKQTQIYLSDKLKRRYNFVVTAFLAFPAYNGTSLLRNEPVLASISEGIQDMISIEETIPKVFNTEFISNDAESQGLLYGNPCKYLRYENDFSEYCPILYDTTRSKGLLQFVINLEANLKNVYLLFMQSNRTEEALKNLLNTTLNSVLIPCGVTATINTVLSQHIDASFEEQLGQHLNQTDSLMKASIIFCLIGFLFIHWVLFKRLQEVHNNFRRCLKVLPLKCLISNFVIKSYLLKTHKGLILNLP